MRQGIGQSGTRKPRARTHARVSRRYLGVPGYQTTVPDTAPDRTLRGGDTPAQIHENARVAHRRNDAFHRAMDEAMTAEWRLRALKGPELGGDFGPSSNLHANLDDPQMSEAIAAFRNALIRRELVFHDEQTDPPIFKRPNAFSPIAHRQFV